jgi:hypothetical protein
VAAATEGGWRVYVRLGPEKDEWLPWSEPGTRAVADAVAKEAKARGYYGVRVECDKPRRRPGSGRPSQGLSGGETLAVRLQPGDRELCEEAAEREGLVLSEWARRVLLAAAR